MKRGRIVGIVVAFAGGIVVGFASSSPRSTPALYAGKAAHEAALSLLEVARGQAGDGSWENIGVARVYYLMGEKQKAREILDRVMAGKLKGNDWIRIGRLYAEAGQWPKAKDAFDKAVAMEPKDAEYAAEVGAYYNLNGDRDHAEELFARSFARKDDEVWNTLNAAGSYVGVRPQ
jgi:tetratricopeptide (TPR) repeat protein